MSRHSYTIEAQHPGGEWFALFRESGLEWCRGYVHHQRAAPGPRLALRLVRSDGRVMDEAPALKEAGIGMVAGWPTAEQYRQAAAKCVARADAIDARATKTATEPA